MDHLKTYLNAGYDRGRIGFGRRAAVVVVDLQKGFLDPRYALGRSPHIQRAASNTAGLLEVARSTGTSVIYTVLAVRADRADAPHWKIDLSACTHGSPGAEVADVVRPSPSDVILTKRAPSGFFGTDLAAILTRQGVDTVLVTGCVTSGCVRATVVDAFSHGFRVIVPEECVGDQTPQQHQSSLFDLGIRYADVLPLKDVLVQLGEIPLAKEGL